MHVRQQDTKTQSRIRALNGQLSASCAHWHLPRSLAFLFFVMCLGCPIATTGAPQQGALRVALIGFTHASSQEAVTAATKVEGRLNSCLTSDPRVLLVDDSIVRPALRGLGYDGSINMSRDEARRVGSAIGCDFYVIGKLEVLTR